VLNLSKRDADVAVRATYQGPEGLAGRRAARIAWAVFGPQQLAGKSFDLRSDSHKHDWITFADTASIAKALKWLKEHVDEDRIVFKTNTMVGLAEAAAGGVGIALLPCFVGNAMPGLTQLTPTLPELEGELWLLTHPDLRNTARVRAFLDYCEAEIGKRRKAIECVV
jgi:DNA-binding transcriptional LysR family regulator